MESLIAVLPQSLIAFIILIALVMWRYDPTKWPEDAPIAPRRPTLIPWLAGAAVVVALLVLR